MKPSNGSTGPHCSKFRVLTPKLRLKRAYSPSHHQLLENLILDCIYGRCSTTICSSCHRVLAGFELDNEANVVISTGVSATCAPKLRAADQQLRHALILVSKAPFTYSACPSVVRKDKEVPIGRSEHAAPSGGGCLVTGFFFILWWSHL